MMMLCTPSTTYNVPQYPDCTEYQLTVVLRLLRLPLLPVATLAVYSASLTETAELFVEPVVIATLEYSPNQTFPLIW
jgi:hypothetical protein